MGTPTRQTHPQNNGIVSTNNIQGGGVWWDEKMPLIGQRIDTTSGRIGYNYTENFLFFADNARYAATEQISISTQVNHDWLIGTNLRPHIHWAQSSANIPNMVLGYRVWDNGAAIPPTWTLMIPAASGGRPSAHVFTYTAGTIGQITTFGEIDMSSITGLSANLQFKIWRDTDLGSGEYAGADPLVGNWLVAEFDYHYQRDAMGSQGEIMKF